jgi:hypothetical protein
VKRSFLFLLLPCLLLAASGTITQTFTFAQSDFVFDQVSGYDVVALPGQYSTSEPGSPNLPLANYQVLIPPDAEVTGIEVTSVSRSVLPGTYNIHPSQRPQVLSKPDLPFVAPDAKVYSQDALYPEQVASWMRSGCMGGYRLAGIQIVPLQYNPARKELALVLRVDVVVRYETGRYAVENLDPSQVELMATQVTALVRNPEQADQWRPLSRTTDDWLCDLAIITNSTLAPSFQAIADWKTARGYKTKVIKTDSIYATYPGRDNIDKIRNCVIDYWRNHGLKWLILGGDDAIVPVRTCRLTVEGNVEDIATDMFYADLQWSWDSDHNGLYGEMTDTVDLFHDVFVGRLVADNASDVAMFFNKCTTYERHPDTSTIRKVLFGSTMLFSPYHGRVINHIIADLFPSGWTFNHLEDPPSGQYASAMNSGYQLAHVAAHGNPTTFSVMDYSECNGLSNGFRKLNYVSSIACQSGWFDGQECLAEGLVKAPNGGCIAVMLNSRYGFGYPPGFGPSEILDLQFYRQFVNREGYQFGTLCASCKDYSQGLSLNQEVWRWCVYELNLFGDPTLNLWLERPKALAVSHSGSIPTGTQTFRVTVLDGTTPVKGALVCAMKGTETYARGWTNSQGWIDLLVNPATTGSMNVSVIAPNFYPYDGTVTVSGSSNNPALVFAGLRIDDGGNGRLDPGETADLRVSLLNAGAVAATSVTAKLRTTCPYLTLIDSTSGFGTIAAGATVEGDAFRVTAASGTPNGLLAELVAAATATEGNWNAFFTTQIGPTPTPRKLWADHDVGNMILSMTSVGAIGTMGPYQEGSGLKYPRTAPYGSLYFTSFAAGNSANYVVDHWYARPSSTWNADWRILDTLHAVVPPMAADQEWATRIDDGAHSTPKGLVVDQWSGSLRDPRYDDFVIVTYTLENTGASPLNGLYCGIFSDFDVNNMTSNSAATDATRRMAWMTDNSSTWVGVKLLSPQSAANLSAISNATYVVPSSMMTEAVKDSFLRGAIHVASGSGANFSCVASAGPFNLAPGARTKVAFAFVGGESRTELEVNADTAQSWYDHEMPTGLTWLKSVIDDAPPGGNGDGILNPGESVNLPTWVVNRSDRPTTGVWATLRKTMSDTLVTLTDSVRRIGSVSSGDSAWTGSNGFKLRVAASCTNGYLLPLALVCRDTLDSASTSLPIIKVGSAQLVSAGTMVWDPPPGGNGNGRIDPGEQTDLAIGISDIGLGNAVNVSARLKSGDSRFLILDSLAFYGNISHDSTVFNASDRYRVQAHSSIPPETQISCTLFISADGYQAVRAVAVPVGMLTAFDPIPDGPRTPALYYAYDDCDTFYWGHPHYNWIECRGRGTQLTLGDDESVTINLPPFFGPFRYYGSSYSQISLCGNGFIMPGSRTESPWTNAGLPSSSAPPMIAANWDDLYPPTGGGVWWFYDTASHALVFEWDSVAYYSPRTTFDKFEIIVMDSTDRSLSGDNNIIIQYQTANGYTSSTTGIQDQSQAIGIQVQYNGSFHRAAAPLTQLHAIRYSTDSVLTAVSEAGLKPVAGLKLAVLPNPVHGPSRVRFSLPSVGPVRLAVHDLAGRCVQTLAAGSLGAGVHTIDWDRRDRFGRALATGVYFMRLETRAGTVNLKAIVVE